MKRLGLFRHAKSDWPDVALRDYDRGLNARGRKGAALMGLHISEYGVRWDRALASTAARIRQTIDAASKAVGHCPPVSWDERLYLAEAATLLEILHQLDDRLDNVMLCGHNPGLEELLLDLAGRDSNNPLLNEVAEKFPTAAFAVLELEIARWADLAPGCAKLVHLARPRDLDAELGPEHRL